MRAVIQRVSEASVKVDGNIIGSIDTGLLLFLGITTEDSQDDIEWLSKKISQVRIFPDDDQLMNLSVKDVNGNVLLISQFTLLGNLQKGTRPSFNRAATADIAIPLYEAFIVSLQKQLGKIPATGKFGADMKIQAFNDGPVTLIVDSKDKKY